MWLLTRTIMPHLLKSVRQYRILQSRFLQCMGRPKPPCDLLILRETTPAYKGLQFVGSLQPTSCHPLEKFTHSLCQYKNSVIFAVFLQLTRRVRPAHAGRTSSRRPRQLKADGVRLSHHRTCGPRVRRFAKHQYNRSLHQSYLAPFKIRLANSKFEPPY